MKCQGCGAELAENAKACSACGRPVGIATRAAEETMHVGKEVGMGLGKIGKGAWGGMKAVGGAAKKEFKKGEKEEQK